MEAQDLVEGRSKPFGEDLAWCILVFQGIGMLLAMQTFTFAESYYHKRLCGSPYESLFENAFNVTFSFTSLCGLCLSVIFQSKFSSRVRIIIPLWITLAAFIINTALVLLPPASVEAEPLFWISVISMGIVGFVNSIQQGGFFAIAGQLPPRFPAAIMVGFGLSGLLISSVSMIAAATHSGSTPDICLQHYEDLEWSTFGYFMFTGVILVFCIVFYFVFMNLKYVQYFLSRDSHQSTKLLSPTADTMPASSPLLIFCRTLPFLYSITITFTITFLLFPSLTVHIKSIESDSQFARDLFTPLHFLIFSAGDTFGRGLCNFKNVLPNTHRGRMLLCILTTARVMFIPAFLFCNVTTQSGVPFALPVVFGDEFFFACVFLFAFSSGYLGTVGMMHAPSHVRQIDMGMAGVMTVFFLTLGLTLGAFSSFAFLPLTNP